MYFVWQVFLFRVLKLSIQTSCNYPIGLCNPLCTEGKLKLNNCNKCRSGFNPAQLSPSIKQQRSITMFLSVCVWEKTRIQIWLKPLSCWFQICPDVQSSMSLCDSLSVFTESLLLNRYSRRSQLKMSIRETTKWST